LALFAGQTQALKFPDLSTAVFEFLSRHESSITLVVPETLVNMTRGEGYLAAISIVCGKKGYGEIPSHFLSWCGNCKGDSLSLPEGVAA
jgi:hypothetical protein